MGNSSLPKALLIIPFYNEEKRMAIKEFEIIFLQYSEISFLLIDDGSNDNTYELINRLEKNNSNVTCKKNEKNLGKAESVRYGVNNSNLDDYDYVGYLDADLATPVSEVVKLLQFAYKYPEKDIIMGSRIKLLGNKVNRSLLRHYLGRIFATIISQFILKIPIYDSQCGAKVFKAAIAKKLFKSPFHTKWLFDVELLLRFKNSKNNLAEKVVELPLYQWTEKGNSKIKWYEFVSVPFQILKLYVKY